MSPWPGKKQQQEISSRQKKFSIKIDPSDYSTRKTGNLKDYLYTLVAESSLPRLLNCNDKMTMANSVEARAPFLDHDFVDLVFSMDPCDFIVNGCRKYPLRNAMRGYVPNEILFRKDKDAFNAPIFDYLRCDYIGTRIRKLFRDARTSDIFSPTAYLAEYERFISRKAADRPFLLHGFFLEEWSRMFEVEHG
jgi:asparagine synthase (glutamine-hydrolysing)